jgi:hypothetical protein
MVFFCETYYRHYRDFQNNHALLCNYLIILPHVGIVIENSESLMWRIAPVWGGGGGEHLIRGDRFPVQVSSEKYKYVLNEMMD